LDEDFRVMAMQGFAPFLATGEPSDVQVAPEGPPVSDQPPPTPVPPASAVPSSPLQSVLLQTLQQPSGPSVPAGPPTHDLAGLLQQLLPLALTMAHGGNPGTQGAFMQGYAHSQSLRQQQAQQQQAAKEKQANIQRLFVDDAMKQLGQIAQNTDLQTWTAERDKFARTFQQLYGGDPSVITNTATYPTNAIAVQHQRAAQARLDAIDKRYPNLLAENPNAVNLHVSAPELGPGPHTYGDLLNVAQVGLSDPVTDAPIVPGTPDAKPVSDMDRDIQAGIDVQNEQRKAAGQPPMSRLEKSQFRLDFQKRQNAPPPNKPGTIEDWVANARTMAVQANQGQPLTPEQQQTTDAAALEAFKKAQRDPNADAQTAALKAMQLSIEQQRLSTLQQQGQPVTIADNSKEYRIAQDLAYGKLTFSQFRSMLTSRGGGTNATALKMAIYDKAGELNPNFNPAQFEMGYRFASDPATQRALVYIDTALPQIDKIMTASQGLNKFDAPAINGLLNKVGFQIGGKQITDVQQLQHLLGPEIGLAMGAGALSDMRQQAGIDATNLNLSGPNFLDTMGRMQNFLAGRKQMLLRQMGIYGQPGANPANPAATGTVKMKAPNGQISPVPADQVEHYKSLGAVVVP
jgi:hypothetical protein